MAGQGAGANSRYNNVQEPHMFATSACQPVRLASFRCHVGSITHG